MQSGSGTMGNNGKKFRDDLVFIKELARKIKLDKSFAMYLASQ
jgi:hypothetical protein